MPRTRLVMFSTLLALGLAGCCRTPIYLEPGGHSTTYRRHLEQYDRSVTASIEAVSFVENPIIVPAEPLSDEPEVSPPMELPGSP